MSDSMQTIAENAAKHAALLAKVAERYPEARMEVLWDSGPCVPLVQCARGREAATKLQAIVIEGTARLIPYFELVVGDDRIRVYWRGNWAAGRRANEVLDAIAKASVPIYARLVEEAKR